VTPPPPQQPYPYPHPYPYPPAYLQPPTNTYAILAAIFAFVVLPPLGIYFGIKAKQQIAQTGERGIELAKVGIIGGSIMTGIQVLGIIVWCGVVGTMMSSFPGFTSP
jgi:hypothetical protein